MGLFSIFFPRRAKIEALENLLAEMVGKNNSLRSLWEEALEENRILKKSAQEERERIQSELEIVKGEWRSLSIELERHKRPRGADGKFKKGTAK